MQFRLSSIRHVSACSIAVLALATASAAQARELYDAPSLGLRLGVGEHYQRAELAWESPSFWTYRFEGGTTRLDLLGELGAAYWRASGSRDPGSVWQLSATPLLRLTWSDRYYVEAGVGATVFSHASFADKNISTAFQFGDHVGVGMFLTPNSRLGLRFSHYSNAGIKRPNPGLNVLQLNYSLQY